MSRKKTFDCGHKGFGQYCHRCVQEAAIKKERELRRAEWSNVLASTPIEISHMPKRIAEKVVTVILELKEHKTYMELGGKRITTIGQRNIISVPISKSYRLICSDKVGHIEFIEVISHETYNNRLSSGGWLL